MREIFKQKQGKELFEQVKLCLTVFGENSPIYAEALGNLGRHYYTNGEYKIAVWIYNDVIKIYKQLGENHLDYIVAISNLGWVYQSAGKYDDAEQIFFKAAELTKQTFGYNHPRYATSLEYLVHLYKEMDRPDDAEPYYYEAKAIREQHDDEWLHGRGSAQNKQRGATTSFDGIDRLRNGVGHKEYTAALGNLALLYEDIGEDEKAEQLYDKSREILDHISDQTKEK